MLGNNLLDLLSSKGKQLSGVSSADFHQKKVAETEKRFKVKKKSPSDWIKSKDFKEAEPHFLLHRNHFTAQLCVSDDERAPLLVSEIKLIISNILTPKYQDPSKTLWFKIFNAKLIPHLCLVIVDGVTVSTFHDLHLGTKQMRRLHRKRLKKGLVSPYLGNCDQDETQTDDQSKDSDCEEPQAKRTKKHTMPEILNGLQSWLPNTSALLPLRVEMVAPALYGNSLLRDIFLYPLNKVLKSDIKFGRTKAPKTLCFVDRDEVLYKQAKGETIESTVEVTIPVSEDHEVPESGKSQSAPTLVYYLQLAQRWEKSRSSECIPSSSYYWNKGNTPDDAKLLKPDKFDRRSLLMSLEDMLCNEFPVHPEVYCKFAKVDADNEVEYSQFVGTKPSYIPVRADSPLFAMDCEFQVGHEVREISVVNECGQVVYHTKVARKGHHSKCREIQCQNCDKATLKDVQQRLIQCLPPDAILVGHSLGNDLSALQMYHPYIIDTSLIYEHDNSLSSLSSLAKHYLGRAIQLARKETHDPTEDALATLHLLQLKLQHGYTFGCKALGGFIPPTLVPTGSVTEVTSNLDKLKSVDKTYCQHYFEFLNKTDHRDDGKDVRSRVHLVAEERFRQGWLLRMRGLDEGRPSIVALPGAEAVLEEVCSKHSDYDLSVAHIKADEKLHSEDTEDRLDALAALDAQLARVHAALPVRSLLTVIFNDSEQTKGTTISNGICMIGIKRKEQLISMDCPEDFQ